MTSFIAAFLGVLIFLMSGQMAVADPSGTIQRFMNTPVSHFSYGMERLNTWMAEVAKDGVYLNSKQIFYNVGGASFDWNKNHITLSMVRFRSLQEDDSANLEEECKAAIDEIRRQGGIFEGQLATGMNMKYSYFASQFFPSGYGLSYLSEEDGKTLDALMSIEVSIRPRSSKMGLTCTAPLLGTGYSVEK